METTAPKAIVIGGGIGGLAAAVALRKVGMAVTVFERAPEICEVGAGLSLWSNAVTALRRLGLESRITELGSPVARMQVVTASGQVLSEITIEELSRKAGAPSLCVHRADLLRTFAEALELSVIRTNATCVGFEQHSDVVTARFADGQSESGDLLLGAGGIQSAIRATPNLGQGACQALEDAVVLADCLRQADGVISGLRSYEERRRRRTAMVTTQSWSLGKVFQWQNPIAIWLRNRSFRTKWGVGKLLSYLRNW